MTGVWVAVLASSAAAYGLKAIGFVLPREWLQRPFMTRVAALMPAALLAALVFVQAFTVRQQLAVDARAAGLVAAAALLLARAPFLAVIAGAVVTTGLLRALGVG